jgi:hypothetical protein
MYSISTLPTRIDCNQADCFAFFARKNAAIVRFVQRFFTRMLSHNGIVRNWSALLCEQVVGLHLVPDFLHLQNTATNQRCRLLTVSGARNIIASL